MTRLGSALYRLLLLAFPAGFRQRHGEAMLAQFVEQQTGLRGRPVARAAHWLRVAVDAVRHGLALRRRRDATGNRIPTRRTAPMDTVLQDIRYGIRLLGRQPGFTTVAVLTLALGTGAVTALASVIDAALLRPLPFPDPGQLVEVRLEERRDDGTLGRPSPALTDVRFWQQTSRSFSQIAVSRSGRTVIVQGNPPERATAYDISEDYFALHGAAPVIGRDVQAPDLLPGAPLVALVGHGFWVRSLGGDPDVIGTPLRLATGAATIVGVGPPGFFPDIDIWRPLQLGELDFMRAGGTRTLARLRPGVTLAAAQTELAGLSPPIGHPAFVERYSRQTARIESLYDVMTRNYRANVRILAGAVAIVVLLACVNVAGLLLARGSGRRGELATRAAIGAGRARLVRQLLTESVVLAAAGASLGIGTAWIWLDGLVALMPSTVPDGSPVTINLTVLSASTAGSVVVGLLFGLVPALALSRAGLRTSLTRSGRGHGAGLSKRGSQFLIASEVALALVLVAGAGLMLRSLDRLMRVDLGFDPDRIIAVDVVPTDPDENGRYYASLVEQVRALPGVEFAGAVDHLPLVGARLMTDGRLDGGDETGIQMRTALPGYFEAMGLRLVDGRLPAPSEASPWSVLSETAARGLAADASPVGRMLEALGKQYLVLGVVSGVRQEGPGETMPPGLYVAADPSATDQMSVVLRPADGAVIPGDLLRRTAEDIGPPVLFDGIRSGSDMLDEVLMTPRKRTGLLSLLGGLGLALALVGLFGVTTYAVSRRTHEIGLRMAFGARPGQVVGRIVLDSAVPAAMGVVAGLALTALLTRGIESYLFETTPTDPVTLTVVALALGACCCVAAWIPGRRAAGIDPTEALRTE